MYRLIVKQVKKLADEAIALQNKDRMDAVLREISAICGVPSAEPDQRETLVTYPTSTIPGGDTPEMKQALAASMEVVKKPAKKAAK